MPDYRHLLPEPPQLDYPGAWARSSIEPLNPMDGRIAALQEAHADYLKMAAGEWTLRLHPGVSDYLTRNVLDETTFFSDFFVHPAVTERLGEEVGRLRPEGVSGSPLGFKRERSWIMTARLASLLSTGAIYSPRGLSDRKVISLVGRFAQAAFRTSFSEAACHFSSENWSDWFDGYRNYSFTWIDLRRGRITVVLVSDSD
ncbi:MAG TPA: hypothetical protein VFQ67_10900 [Allosphingosinicella sp.]|jgi:hypothetical protein|nr:hypothetical protein [Allosphingosinicella sp.]